MAWINEGSRFVWDVEYTSWVQAFNRAQELAEQYHIFAETAQTEDRKHIVITYSDIGNEAHSSACRCEHCW